MRLFAIFGDPVEHSRSPLMHNLAFKALRFNACYTRVHLKDGSKLRERFLDLSLNGANVTVPHKEEAFKACDEVRGYAKKLGVVNTIVLEDGKLIGYNTDADGFVHSIAEFTRIKQVLLLGSGGTAKALAPKLTECGYKVVVLNRSQNGLDHLRSAGIECYTHDEFSSHNFDLILNTTSAGLSDDSLPAREDLLKDLLQNALLAYDVIYGKMTPFLELAKSLGVEYKDGSSMLLAQGVLANRLFTQNLFSVDEIEPEMRRSFLL